MSASFRFVFLAIVVLGLYFFPSSRLCSTGSTTPGNADLRHGQDRKSLLLDEGQCRDAFPLLIKELDDAVAAGPFRFKRAVDDYTAQTHARIKDGKVKAPKLDGVTLADISWPLSSISLPLVIACHRR
jgi:hypothetical protein